MLGPMLPGQTASTTTTIIILVATTEHLLCAVQFICISAYDHGWWLQKNASLTAFSNQSPTRCYSSFPFFLVNNGIMNIFVHKTFLLLFTLFFYFLF